MRERAIQFLLRDAKRARDQGASPKAWLFNVDRWALTLVTEKQVVAICAMVWAPKPIV